MEIIRISDKDGIVIYERQDRGVNRAPKYVVVNDKTGAVIGEVRRRKAADKLARTMRKANKVMREAQNG